MHFRTNPVLSSAEPTDKTQAAAETKVSSADLSIPVTQPQLTNFESIIQQIEQKKYIHSTLYQTNG
jgi:hypothetical protein